MEAEAAGGGIVCGLWFVVCGWIMEKICLRNLFLSLQCLALAGPVAVEILYMPDGLLCRKLDCCYLMRQSNG